MCTREFVGISLKELDLLQRGLDEANHRLGNVYESIMCNCIDWNQEEAEGLELAKKLECGELDGLF